MKIIRDVLSDIFNQWTDESDRRLGRIKLFPHDPPWRGILETDSRRLLRNG
jgi:hypothetical protein